MTVQAARWEPSSGIFGPTTDLDHRLFDDRHELRPEVRRDVMERLDQALRVDTGLVGSDWQDWTKVYLAGGSASEWAGGRPNDAAQDLDILIGVNYFEARRHDSRSGAFQNMDSGQIGSAFNAALRAAFNDPAWQPSFGGTWGLTGYVNPNALDITVLKPYAAYNITDMTWAVRPPHLPGHSVADFHPALVQEARAIAMEARAILRLPEPERTWEARALWERLHAGRRRAFGPEGEGWQDPGNVLEKWLAYAPGNILAKIRELALAKTAKLEPGEPLPVERGLFYRLHHQDAPFGPAHARSRDFSTPAIGQAGYSAFPSPHHLRQYMEKMEWIGGQEVGWPQRHVISFHGREVGRGADNEPLVMPHSSDVHERMDWDTFRSRLRSTPQPHKPWDASQADYRIPGPDYWRERRQRRTAVLPGGDLSHLDQHERPVEWVRTDALMPHREWEHGPGWSRDPQDPAARYAPRHTPQSWAENARSVAGEGIHQPIHLTWNPKTNEAKITEGNSRLMWAAEAGHEAVPVTGHRNHYAEGHPLPGPSRAAEFPGHIPADLRPSSFLPEHYMYRPSQRTAAGSGGGHPGPFWHGSINRIEPGSYIDHNAPPEGHGRLQHSFFTTSREVAEDAADSRDGRGHGWVHQVEPIGPYLVDHGEPESWKSAHPLRVLSTEPGRFGPRHPHPGRWSQREASGSDGDRNFTCSQGHEHWGAHGAAGLLIRHKGEDGLWRYLLQKRSGGKEDHGGLWSVPSGAIGKDEDPFEGARREYREEMGPLPQGCKLHHSVTSTDCGDWQFTTHVVDAPEHFLPRGGGETEHEVSGAAWHTAKEVSRLKDAGELHPAFARSWETVRASRGQREAATPERPTKDKSDVRYRQATEPGKSCATCVMSAWLAPDFESGKCDLVKGLIERGDVCDAWEPEKGTTKEAVSLDLRPEGPTKVGVTGYDGQAQRTGMIYLEVPDGVIRGLPGGVDDHHITLVYLGKGLTSEQFEKACRRAAEAAARSRPLEGVLCGVQTFPPSDGKVPVFVPAYIPGIGALRRELEDLSASEHRHYQPHATLAYLEDGDRMPPPHPPVHLRWTHLSAKRGDEIRRYPLGRLRMEARDREPSAPAGRTHRIIDLTRRNGGHSVSLTSGRSPSSGYMVAQKTGSHVLPAEHFFGEHGHRILRDYVHAHKEDFGRRGAHLGTWHDHDSGKVFLDISHNVGDLGEATSMAKQHDQIAVWDLAKKQEIATGGTGGLEKQASAETCRACGLEVTPVSATLEFLRRGGRGAPGVS